MMKRIGVTQRMIEESQHGEIRDCLDTAWATILQEMNMLPIVLPSAYPPEVYFHELKLDGVILTGGNDLSVINQVRVNQRRDRLEASIIENCIRHNVPLIGVCRGMQMLGHFFGMNLQKVDGHIAVTHRIQVEAHTGLGLFGKEQEVNSYHQYAIKKCSADFDVWAYSEDGVIEAFLHRQHKIYGQMWHPEREQPFYYGNLNFIQHFFAVHK